MYLVLYDKVFGGLRGNVDRLFDDHFDAELYCTAQNNAVHYVDNLEDKWGSEYWIVLLPDDRGSPDPVEIRVLHSAD
jgi:hypothetical protein